MITIEACNLFAGDHDPTASHHLEITELKLPELQEKYAEHEAGGARVAIEIATIIQKLDPSFKFIGTNPELLTQFGLGSKQTMTYTAYEVARDRLSGVASERKIVMRGRLGKVTEDAFKAGDLVHTDYAIMGLVHYELWQAGNELLYWDFAANIWRVNGADQNADLNRILRIS